MERPWSTAVLHFSMRAISDMARAHHTLLLPRSLAVCVFSCLDIVRVSKLGSQCCGERKEGGRAGRSLRQGQVPPLPPSLLWGTALHLLHGGLHWSNIYAWPCTSLIQIPALTHGMTSRHDPRSVSSLWTLTIGILVWPSLPSPACPPPWLGLWDRHCPAGLHELPLVLPAPGLPGNHWPLPRPKAWCT